MKRKGYLYEQIISVSNCKTAILNAAKHKGNRKNVQKILADVDKYAKDLSLRLQVFDFTSPYHMKEISDGLSGKTRTIAVPRFYPDQCAHHAIVQIIRPIIEKSSYHWSYANMPKRGIKRACIGVERATVRDQKAELFLQDVDWLIKHKYHIKHYVRYADDMVLIGNNKRKLRKAMYGVIAMISSYNMTIKKNYQLYMIWNNGRGRKIDFVGRCFGKGFATIRKRRALACMRQSRKI